MKVLRKLYFCTSNKGKLSEYREILGKLGVRVSMARVKVKEVQSESLEEVATEKAREAFEKVKKPVFVEDAGLFVDALKGFPGVYSSYVMKTIGNDGLLKLMEGVKNRRACFKAVIAFADEDGRVRVFEGKCEGSIANEKKGSEGFGFDPIFIPRGYGKTFAEDLRLKNEVSHRRKAIEKFVSFLRKSYLLKGAVSKI